MEASPSMPPTTRKGSPIARTSVGRPPTVPTCQSRKDSMVWRSVSSTPWVQQLTAAVSAAPAMATFIGVLPSRPSAATRCTSTMAAAAPANPNHT